MTYLPPIGKGPPLVYVPGLDGSGELLFAQEPELAEHFRLLRMRSRGDRRFGYDDLLDDVTRALDAHGIERATLLGESFGGTVALQYALRHPDRVSRLVLVSTFAYFSNRRLLELGLLLCRTFSPRTIFSGKRIVDRPTLRLDGVPRDVLGRLVATTRRQPPDGYVRRVELIAGYDVRERLGEIEVPALVIVGGRDRLVPPGEGEAISTLLPRASLRILPHAGHACLLDRSISLVGLINEWESAGADDRWPVAG